MTEPPRRRVSEIFHAAAALLPADRGAYLAAACGGDDALRREVDWLLAHEHDSHFLDVPAIEHVANPYVSTTGATESAKGKH